MKVYQFGPDWIVAESPEDALAAWAEATCEDPADYLDDDGPPEEVDGADVISVHYDDLNDVPAALREEVEGTQDGGRLTIMLTAAEWATRERRGILCSSEW